MNGRNWTHRHTGILLIYIAHVATLVGVGGGGGLSVNLTHVWGMARKSIKAIVRKNLLKW